MADNKAYPTYDASMSGGGANLVVDFCTEETVLSDVRRTPGVGTAVAEVLEDHGIVTVAQLLAQYLLLIDGERTTQEVCQALFNKIKDMLRGTRAKNANVHTIVFAVANWLTEKGVIEYDETFGEDAVQLAEGAEESDSDDE